MIEQAQNNAGERSSADEAGNHIVFAFQVLYYSSACDSLQDLHQNTGHLEKWRIETADRSRNTSFQDLAQVDLDQLSISVHPETTPATFNDLPNELIRDIIGYLDTLRPSDSPEVYDEPHFNITKSDHTPLKTASCINKKWRQTATPILFKHAHFTVAAVPPKRSALHRQIQPFFHFLQYNGLGHLVETFTLLIEGPKIAYKSEHDHERRSFSLFWATVFEYIDPTEILIVAPAEALGELASCSVYIQEAWAFDCPYQYLRLRQPGSSKSRSALVDQPTHGASADAASNQSTKRHSNRLGQALEEALTSDATYNNPSNSQLGAITPPSLSASSSSSPSSLKNHCFPAVKSTLWNIRPWSSCLLNEGSFIRAYASYEFWLRQPPSLLPDILGDKHPPSQPMFSSTIKDFSYIGIFPMTHHFGILTTHCPRIDRLYVQLVPRNEILQSQTKMKQVEREDLWMERNSCYAFLMRELFTAPAFQNFKNLKEFESGDAADDAAWRLAVEYVKRHSGGWKATRQGVFVKGDADARPTDEHGAELSSFDGNLQLWAWNDVQSLPVSSVHLYTGGN